MLEIFLFDIKKIRRINKFYNKDFELFLFLIKINKSSLLLIRRSGILLKETFDWRRDPPIQGAGYKPAGISMFSRAERSHEVYSGAI